MLKQVFLTRSYADVMKVVIKDPVNELFLKDCQRWTPTLADATDFQSLSKALLFGKKAGMPFFVVSLELIVPDHSITLAQHGTEVLTPVSVLEV